jgi:hypothetical protein
LFGLGDRRAALALGVVSWVVLAGLGAPLAWAQAPPLSVVQSVAGLSPADQGLIKAFVDRHAPDLSSAEPARIRDARNALMQPLADPRVGVPFRLEMSRQLAPVLDRLTRDPTPVVAVNAVRLAGEIATDRSADVVAAALTSQDPSVRLSAAAAAARVFEAVRTTTPALSVEPARTLAERVAEQLKAETEPNVADALARALISAGGLSAGGFAPVRGLALERLTTVMLEPVQGWTRQAQAPAEPARVETLLRTLSALRQEMTADQGASETMPARAVWSAGKLADETLAFVAEIVKAERLPVVSPERNEAAVRAERGWAVSAAGAAEQVVFFTRERLGGRTPPAGPSLAATLEGGTKQADARFIADAEALRRELAPLLAQPPR